MKRITWLLCLTMALLVLLTSCGEAAPVFSAHTHTYTATHTNGTCVRYGSTEYRCHCGDHYTVTDTVYGDHKLQLPANNTDLPQATVLMESENYYGIRGAYCTECGTYFSFERTGKFNVDIK